MADAEQVEHARAHSRQLAWDAIGLVVLGACALPVMLGCGALLGAFVRAFCIVSGVCAP